MRLGKEEPMKRLAIILAIMIAIILIPSRVRGAAFTSKAAGNWSATGNTTWTQDGSPTDGDTVTLTHHVTDDANVTVGTSPGDSTTYVITINDGGELIIGASVSLTVRGNIYLAEPTNHDHMIQLGAGSNLIMDASQATPNTQAYYIYHYGLKSAIYARGTSGNHATITSLAGYGKAQIATRYYHNGGGIDAEYLDISYFGDASNYALAAFARADNPFYCRYCTFDNYGQTIIGTATTDGTVTFEDCTVTNPQYASYAIGFTGVADSSATLSIKRNVITNGLTGFNPAASLDVEDNFFGGGAYAISVTSGTVRSFSLFKNLSLFSFLGSLGYNLRNL